MRGKIATAASTATIFSTFLGRKKCVSGAKSVAKNSSELGRLEEAIPPRGGVERFINKTLVA